MKTTLVMVSSLNGKITRDHNRDISSWTSREDAKFFSTLRDRHNLIVMGRRTYEAVRNEIRPNPGKLRVVMTKKPAKFSREAVKGSLEFTNDTPSKLMAGLESRGFRRCLLVGGSEVAAIFLKSNLVDELYLTIEPKLFGRGTPMLAEGNFEATLKLADIKRLNGTGTLNLKYKILRPGK